MVTKRISPMSQTPASGRFRLLTPLLRSRWLSGAIIGAAVLHVGLNWVGAGGWPCPMLNATGYPCPGCGLGRACAQLGEGNWGDALRLHAFAPVLVLTLLLLAVGLALPGRHRTAFLAWVRRFEDRTRITPILAGALIFYWVLRLALDGGAVAALNR